ncbi:MAG: AAA family ATPase [bacterium]|nr:AAA family ATPase [bacterium]
MSPENHSRIRVYIANYFEALVNIFIFLPYFFSVKKLLHTLFDPWKNLSSPTVTRGFSFSTLFNNVMFDLISRGIGAMMRGSIVFFFVLLLLFYFTIIPFVSILFVLSIPVALGIFSITPSEEEHKQAMKEVFIKNHLLNEENYQYVEQWYEYIYDLILKPEPWWKLKHLMSIPPLARDWSMGYTPTLDEYVDDLTSTGYQMSIRKHVIGRTKESAMIERALSKSEEANAIIVGQEGVGKHTIINDFARRIYEGKVTSLLAYKRVLLLNMEKILSKYTDKAQRESFFEELMKEASISQNVVIVIDNFDRYVNAEQGETDLSSSIEKFAKTNKLQIVGITTPYLYESFVFPKTNIRSLFTKIDVYEISKEHAKYILLDRVLWFEKRYQLIIPYEIIGLVIEKGDFYLTSVPFPEKALQLMDSVCVYTKQAAKATKVLPEYVDTVLANKTHTPTTLSDVLKVKLLHLEELLSKQIIGQKEAINELSAALRRAFLMIGKRKKPLASFLFLGPTGVGKTETAKVLSSVFFDSSAHMSRFDMSIYQSTDDIGKLLGSVEKLNPGLLTKAVREHPYGVLLLDEIEKAHPDLLNIFLTILDEGYFTDSYGQLVDCKNLVIIGTSNAGSDHMYAMLAKATLQTQGTDDMSTNSIIDYLVEKKLFSPEFLNRFDGVVAYHPLDTETALIIAQGLARSIEKEIMDSHGVTVRISTPTIEKITKEGYNIQYGVRNLQRIFMQHVEDVIAKALLDGSVKKGETMDL